MIANLPTSNETAGGAQAASCCADNQAASVCTGNHTLQQAKDMQRCFWQPGNATDLALLPKLQRCLRGKIIYIVGTSVSRNWFFVLQQLMAANATQHWSRSPGPKHYRQQQKAACGGGTEAARESCRGTNIVFRWQNQNIFDEDLAAALRSGNHDIIIANMGLGNLVHHNREWVSRLLKQGRQLADLAASLPSSTRFYYRTTTPICQHGKCSPDKSFQGCGVPEETNSKIEIGNMVLEQLLLCRDPRVQVLDIAPLTDCSFYEDHVHHPHLTIDHVLLFITRECPHLKQDVLRVCPHLCNAICFGRGRGE
jgi:hypothetical protein